MMTITINGKQYSCTDTAYYEYKEFFTKIKNPKDMLTQFGFLLDMEVDEHNQKYREKDLVFDLDSVTNLLYVLQDSYGKKIIKPKKEPKSKKPSREFKIKRVFKKMKDIEWGQVFIVSFFSVIAGGFIFLIVYTINPDMFYPKINSVFGAEFGSTQKEFTSSMGKKYPMAQPVFYNGSLKNTSVDTSEYTVTPIIYQVLLFDKIDYREYKYGSLHFKATRCAVPIDVYVLDYHIEYLVGYFYEDILYETVLLFEKPDMAESYVDYLKKNHNLERHDYMEDTDVHYNRYTAVGAIENSVSIMDKKVSKRLLNGQLEKINEALK